MNSEYDYGFTRRSSEHLAAQRKALADRVRKEDEERAANHQAWLRFCGMLGPIGGLK